jgi:hypothetical protein
VQHPFTRLRKHGSVSLSSLHPPLFSSFSLSPLLSPAVLKHSLYLILQDIRGSKTQLVFVKQVALAEEVSVIKNIKQQ